MHAAEHDDAHDHTHDTDDHAAGAADIPLPEARITNDQLQAARRILERELRELRAQMRRDAAAPRERPSS